MLRILNSVLRLSDANPDSSQYAWYCFTSLSGMAILMTFGILIVSWVDKVMVRSPNGKSWITWGLQIYDIKCSIWGVATSLRGALTLETGAPLP